MRRVDSLEKTLMLGGIGSRSRRGWQRMRWLDGISDAMDMRLSRLWIRRPGVLQSIGTKRVRHDWATELIDIVKGFSVVNEAEVDIFLEFSSIFLDATNVDNLNSDSSAFSKSSFYIWKFFVHILLKSSLKDFEHYFASMWNECNYAVAWTFFGISLLWDWNENSPFPLLWPLLSFPNLLTRYLFMYNHNIVIQLYYNIK